VARTLEEVFAQNLDDGEMQAALAALPEEAREALEGEIGTLLGGETVRLREAAQGRGGA